MPYSVPNLVTMRAAGHAETRWRLSCAPRRLQRIWTVDVNGTSTRGARTVNVHHGALWNGAAFADVLAGQPVFVETAYGVMRVRLKAAVGNFLGAMITVAQNNIPWADGQAITVYRDYPLFPVRPRITAAGVFLKDYDVAYTDQNEEPPPVAVMGPDWAGELVGSPAAATATLDGTDSYAMAAGATIASYAWTAEPALGAAIAAPAASATTVTFTLPGPYWIKLTVTDSNGKSDYTRALFHAHDAATYPWIPVERVAWSNAWEGGASPAEFVVETADASLDGLPNLARILFWTEDYLDGALNYQGGWTGRGMAKFGGYLARDTVRVDPELSLVEFQAVPPRDLLDRMANYSVALEYAANPTRWYQYANGGITLAHALHHLMRWHSTLLQVHPVYLPTGWTERRKAIEEFEKASLLQQMLALAAHHGLFAQIGCTSQGALHVEPDAQLYPTRYGAGLALTSRDWTGDLVVERQPARPTSFAQVSGFAYNGAAATPLVAKSGEVLDDLGEGEVNAEGVMLATQALSNALVGRIMAQENNEYPRASLELAPAQAQSLALDVVPQRWHTLTVDPDETVRGFDWSAGQDAAVRQVDVEYADGVVTKRVELEPYAEGPPGITGDYPTELPNDDPDDGDYPPVEDPPWPPGPPPEGETGKHAVSFDDVNGPQWYDADLGTWAARNAGLPSLATLFGIVKHGWQTIQGTADPESCILITCGVGFIAVSTDAGKTWSDRTPATAPPNDWADVPAPAVADVTFTWLADNNATDQVLYAVAEWQNPATNWRGWLLRSADLGLTWTWQALGGAAQVPVNYVATRSYGLYRSSDVVYGNASHPTWEQIGSPTMQIERFAVDRFHDHEFVACLGRDPSDPASSAAPYWDIWTMDPSAATPAWTLRLTHAQAEAESGLTLQPMTGCFINSASGEIYGLAAEPIAPGSGHAFFISEDGGATWSSTIMVGSGGAGNSGNVYASPAVATQLWACLNCRIYYSIDRGLTWNLKEFMLGAGWTPRVLCDTFTGVTYAGHGNGGPNLAKAPAGAGYVVVQAGAGIEDGEDGWMSLYDNQKVRVTPLGGNLWYSDTGGGPGTWASRAGAKGPRLGGVDTDPDKLMTGRTSSGSLIDPHVVNSTDDCGVTWFNKGGANCNIAGTGGGDSIPYDCGGVAKEGLYCGAAGVGLSVRPLGMAVDFQDSTRLYLSTWEDGLIRLRRFWSVGLTPASWAILYGCSQLDMENGMCRVWPRVVWQPGVGGFGDIVYAFGSDGAGAGLVQESTDGAASFTDRSGGLATALAPGLVRALVALGDGAGGVLYFYAFGSDANVYAENGAWVWDAGNPTPFAPDAGGVSVGYDAGLTALLANRVAGAAKVEQAASPYTVWADVTDGHPITGGTPVVIWVTP